MATTTAAEQLAKAAYRFRWNAIPKTARDGHVAAVAAELKRQCVRSGWCMSAHRLLNEYELPDAPPAAPEPAEITDEQKIEQVITKFNETGLLWPAVARARELGLIPPAPRNRVMKGLTWADAIPRLISGEFTHYKRPNWASAVLFDKDLGIPIEDAGWTDIEISTKAKFDGQEVNP